MKTKLQRLAEEAPAVKEKLDDFLPDDYEIVHFWTSGDTYLIVALYDKKISCLRLSEQSRFKYTVSQDAEYTL